MLSSRIIRLKLLGRGFAVLIVGLMFISMFGSIASASISIGDDVKVTTNLNVRTGLGTDYLEITDPDYPGYAPTGTMGIIISGPSSANGYTWWEVDYGPGLYSGWSVEGGLEEIEIDLTVTSVNAPTSAEPGGYIAVSWTVKNQGDAPSGSFYNRVSLATTPYGTDISLGNFLMNSIASGSSLSDAQVLKIPETVSQGYYYVTVFTDAFKTITESEGYNNINKAPNQIHVTGCECTSGPCCDGCNFRPSSYVCDSQYQTEYSCPWGTGCGDDVGVRYKKRYCSGSSSTCSGSISSWGSWQVTDYCGDTETCSSGDSTCNYDLSCEGCSASECEYNSQCYPSGTCHPITSKQKCSNGNWMNSCGDGNCNCGENSGNCPSDCCTSHHIYNCYNNDVYWYDSCENREDKKEECGSDSCGSWSSNYCGTDGNVYHSKTCHNRGCSGSSCFDNTYIEEVKVQDCTDGNMCTSDSCDTGSCVYTPITLCINNDDCCPSGCNSINDNDCSVNCGNGICESGENCGNCLADCPCPSGQICCSGSCTTPACSSNSDCNGYNSCTTDTCNSAGTCSASCLNNPITSCINNDDCCPPSCNSVNDNDCPVSCTDECSYSGEKTCTDSTHYKTCGTYDSDSCLEWSSVYSCPSGQTCSGGSCQAILEEETPQPAGNAFPAPSDVLARTKGEFAMTQWGIGVYHYITWDYDFENIEGFVIERKFNPHPYSYLNPKEIDWLYPVDFNEVGRVGPNVRIYRIADPVPKITSTHTTQYRVAAISADGHLSEWSNIASISPDAVNAPSNLIAKVVDSNPPRVELHWKDNSNNEIGFTIYREKLPGAGPEWIGPVGGGWNELSTVDANVETFTDHAVVPEHTFKYVVHTFTDDGYSLPSDVIAVYIQKPTHSPEIHTENNNQYHQCQQEETNCNGVCVNTNTDNNNCGECGHKCPDGQTCENKKCKGKGILDRISDLWNQIMGFLKF